MKKINAHIRAAGQRLTEVNARLAKKREIWNGKVFFVDGVKEISTPPIEAFDFTPESVPERISRFWVAGNLFYRNSKGQIKPFPKPEIEGK